MEAIRLETTVRHDGTINVPGVKAGQDVEVIVLFKATGEKSYPLRGTAGVYRLPFDPAIPESDWERFQFA